MNLRHWLAARSDGLPRPAALPATRHAGASLQRLSHSKVRRRTAGPAAEEGEKVGVDLLTWFWRGGTHTPLVALENDATHKRVPVAFPKTLGLRPVHLGRTPYVGIPCHGVAGTQASALEGGIVVQGARPIGVVLVPILGQKRGSDRLLQGLRTIAYSDRTPHVHFRL